ncbi:uncharacterized protein LOC122619093 [Drosophila teissieri]|uniref:uncharacterized protein LOC122619093 n=1 Tax=Drosophila teissieri TaxID=7243 RepID=UPI001CBA3E90|nr:uncharacterized protein LOC122619093 [Drosophila teissieri]
MFLYLMTISISLVLIMENNGTPLMSLLDGTFLEAHNRSTESPEGGLSSYPWRSPEAGRKSSTVRTSKTLSRKHQKVIGRTYAEEEERKRIESLWDPVLNQSYDFSSSEEYNATAKTTSEKFRLEDTERLQKNMSQQKLSENSTHLDYNADNSSSLVITEKSYENENQTDEIGIEGGQSQLPNVSSSYNDFPNVDEYWFPVYNHSSTCIYYNSTEFQNQTLNNYNYTGPCLAPEVNGTLSSVKNQLLLGSISGRNFRTEMQSLSQNLLKVHLFMNPNPVYGKKYAIFTTMPSLGNTNFVLNLTVDTNDYLIDEVNTTVSFRYGAWSYTHDLRKLLRHWGIRSKRVSYNSCHFHRSSARFYNTKHKYIMAKVSPSKDRRKLLTQIVRFKITVHRPPKVACLPALELEFCKSPETPVHFSPMGHLEFFATISDECSTVEYDHIEWQFCDITEKKIIARLEGATGLVVKLLPYKVHLLHYPERSRLFLLRGKVVMNGITTVARCYMRYRPPPIEPLIKGNERRLVDVRKPIFMDGSSSKDRLTKKESIKSKRFLWSCRSSDDPSNEYCQKDMSESPKLRLPPYALEVGAVYDFSLTVTSRSDPRNRKTTSQKVKGIAKTSFTPQILCRRNCNLGVYAPMDSVHLIPKCDDCPGHGKRYEWWLLDPGSPPYLESSYKYLILHTIEPLVQIRLRVWVRGNRWADAFYTLRRNNGPQNGSCTVSPGLGIESLSMFEINCPGYESPFRPITFRYMVSYAVVASNVPYSRIVIPLPATEILIISVCDAIDMCVEKTLRVKVLAIDKGILSGIDEIMEHVPHLLHHGHWNSAYIRAIAATTFLDRSIDGFELYSYLQGIFASTGSQLEQITSVAAHMLIQLHPIDFRGAIVMAELFQIMGDTFLEIALEHEWLHREGYFSLSAMHMFFMSLLGQKTQSHSNAMCSLHNPACMNLQRIDLVKPFVIKFDPLILERINSWLMSTWFLYRCIFFLGVIATQRHHPYDDALTIYQSGIAYQINVTEVTHHAVDIKLKTIDHIHLIKISTKLLFELKHRLNHSSILLQIISQQNFHNIYWWYPDPLPSKTSVLIVHAYSPVKFFRNAQEFQLSNPLVYKTNITQFNDQSFNQYMTNNSIQNSTEVHIYSLMLNHKAMLAVRIVNCSELMYVKMRLHRWPTLGQIRQQACRITPDMKGKRIWMANSCERCPAYVAIHKPGEIRYKNDEDTLKSRGKPKGNKTHRAPDVRKNSEYVDYENEEAVPEEVDYLNYSILLEIYQCNIWMNRSLDPGWSEEFCTTTFEHSRGSSVQCTCYTLGVLSSRIFPISTELFVEHIPVPIFSFNMTLLVFFVLLCLLLIFKWLLHLNIISAYLRDPEFLQCDMSVAKSDPSFRGGPEILIVIVTGGQEFAGTTSNIKFYLKSPHRQQTSYQITQDPGHPLLVRNSTIKITVPRGQIYIPTRLALRLVPNGRYPSWYCRSIIVVDLKFKVQQLFLVESWIERRSHMQFMRSKYFTFGSYRKSPKYTWCKRFRSRMEQLYVSWYLINAITGPSQSKAGGIIMSRFERTCVWICKTAITVVVVALYFGKHTTESIQEETRENISNGLQVNLVAVLGFYAFVIGLLVHLLFEVIILRWIWPET